MRDQLTSISVAEALGGLRVADGGDTGRAGKRGNVVRIHTH